MHSTAQKTPTQIRNQPSHQWESPVASLSHSHLSPLPGTGHTQETLVLSSPSSQTSSETDMGETGVPVESLLGDWDCLRAEHWPSLLGET